MVWYRLSLAVMTNQRTTQIVIDYKYRYGLVPLLVSSINDTPEDCTHRVLHCHYLVCHLLWCQLGSNDTLDNCTHTFALQAKILYPFAFTFLALKRTLVFIFFLRFYRKYSYIHNYAVTELSRDLDWWFLADMRASPCAVIVMSCCV